ncbi:MAG: hypothetical protein IH606_01610 [Burkholderiales bacterium]|nr:hypothetical protein [Burkholderiales bacterium]
MSARSWNLALGLVCVAFALLAVFVWIPHDVSSGVIVQERGQTNVGDAMAPTAWCYALGALGLLLVLTSWRSRPAAKSAVASGPRITAANVRFLALLIFMLVVSLVLMRYAGPVLVALLHALGANVTDYRSLRDAIPWKYLGFVIGGTTLVAGLLALIEGRIRTRQILLALIAVIVIALIVDLPFKHLPLPPNNEL